MTQVAASEIAPAADVAVCAEGRRSSPPQPGPAVRLNTFQVLMRRWRELHPYNAGQAMRVSGGADMDRWRHAVLETIHEVGLGIPVLTYEGWRVAFRPIEDVAIEAQHCDLASFTNVELNRPFADGELPIRFTILTGAGTNGDGDDSHMLVAIYDHWIADSRAMRELMHRIWERYRNPDGSSALRPLTLQAPHFAKLFRKHLGFLYRSRAIRESIKNVYRHRHAYRINLRNPAEFESHVIYHSLPDGVIGRVHAFAKAGGASVNDVFLAVMGQLMGEYTAEDRYGRRKKKMHFTRDQIGLGTIVDIRDAARQPLDDVFGLYLSNYTVVLKTPEKQPLRNLTGEIAERTRRIKKTNGAVKGYTALMMARLSWDWLPALGRERLRAHLFHKNVPVTAGISNVNMTKSWADDARGTAAAANRDDGPVVLDYLRISPTGPLSPLVFTLTTIGKRLSLCCTYRTTAFTAEEARELVNRFTARLGEIVE